MRFETEPGEQAQVDWGSFSYVGADGPHAPALGVLDGAGLVANDLRRVVRRADVASFMQCHVNAFEYFGGVPRRCLFDIVIDLIQAVMEE